MGNDTSDKSTTSIFTVKDYSDDRSSRFLQNVGTYVPECTALLKYSSSRSPDRKSNPVPPEYVAGVLNASLRL
jgi:hypothetical protein